MTKINCKTRLSAKGRKLAQEIIDFHEHYKNSYFWNPSGGASSRRSAEKRFAANKPEAIFITKYGIIEVKFDYSESCKNVYYSSAFTLDGKTKNIRIIKKLFK